MISGVNSQSKRLHGRKMADEITQVNETPLTTIEVTEVDPTNSPREDGRKTLKKQGSSFKEEVGAVLTSLAAGRLPPLTENPPRMTIDPAQEAEMESTISISTTMVTVSLMLAMALIIPIFWCLRIDGTVSWSWAVTCIPLWIFNVFICISPCLVPPTNADGTPWTLPRQLYGFFTFVLELLTQVFIVKKLDGDFNWTLAQVLVPYFVYDGLNCIERMLPLIRGTQSILASMVSDEFNFPYVAIRFVQILLITARVDGHLGTTSWWVVFIPAWIFVSVAIVFAVACVVASERVSKIVPQLESLSKLITAGLGLGLVLALLPIVIIALRLSGGSFSTFFILLPIFVLTGILFFGGAGMFIKTVWFTSYTPVLISSPKHESSETEYTTVQEQV